MFNCILRRTDHRLPSTRVQSLCIEGREQNGSHEENSKLQHEWSSQLQ
jgi:hypothetical protein